MNTTNGNGGSVTLFGKSGGLPASPSSNVKRFLTGASAIASTSTRPEHPYVSFSRDGEWSYGSDQETFDLDGTYAFDPTSMQVGYIGWAGKRPHIHMVPVGEPEVDPAKLPDIGVAYDKGYSANFKALSGKQAGKMFQYRVNSYGGRDFYEKLIRDIGQATVAFGLADADDYAVPVVRLSNSSYEHKEWAQVFKPEYIIKEWLRFSDGSPLSDPTPPSASAAAETIIEAEIIPPAKPANSAGRRRPSSR